MKLGVHIGYWGLGLSSQDQLEIVQEAEKLGYDSVWTAEAYGSDSATVLAWLAGQTSKIRLGSGIFQMPGRSPAMTAMTAATIDQLSGGRMILGIGSSGPQVAEGWHGQRFAKQLQRTREYVAVVRKALARERLEFHGETLELPLPDGPGKALKLTIAPVQEKIPVYLAAIGPKNTALAGEIADGWIPTLFSPEHVSELRPLLQEGADSVGRSLDGFDIAPTVNVFVTDDLQGARNAMRPFIALYVGGMGSRKQNFYNNLVCRYGFESDAKVIQDLYLEGKREEAMAAIPDALIDMVSLCGPKDVVRERLAVYRDAGVGTLGITPIAFNKDDRLEQLRSSPSWLAEEPLRASRRLRLLLGAFGDPGHAFPMIALGRALAARGHDVTVQTWERWRAPIEAEGLTFTPAPEYSAFPIGDTPLDFYEAVVYATRDTLPLVRELEPDVVVHDILTLGPSLAAEIVGVPRATLIPHVFPEAGPGFPIYSFGARLPRTRLGRAFWERAHLPVHRGLDSGRLALNRTRAQVGLPAARLPHGGTSRELALVATFPQLEYPRPWPAHVHVVGPLMWEPPADEVAPPQGDAPLVLVAPSTSQDPDHRLLHAALRGLADAPVRVLATYNRRLPSRAAACA